MVNHPPPPRDHGGFTLLEVVLTLIILSVAGAIGVQVIGSGMGGYAASQELLPLITRGSLALERMARELQRSSNCGSVATPLLQVRFNDTAGNPVTFLQEGTTIQRLEGAQQVLLVEGVAPGTLSVVKGPPGSASCLVRLEFRLQPGLEITSGPTTPIPFRTEVYVRNQP